MGLLSAATISIHLGDEAQFRFTEFPDCEVGPFASIEIAGGVTILADDPDTVYRLSTVMVSAARWLASVDDAESAPGDTPHLSAVIP